MAAVGFELERARLLEFRTRVNLDLEKKSGSPLRFDSDGTAFLQELDPKNVRKLDLLGPFGVGNRRPSFESRVQLVGHPSVDSRTLDLRFRVVQDGTLMPARFRGGASQFEALRGASKGQLRVTYSPRLAQWAEEGPVELHVSHLVCG